jgi:hypothetical protein
VDWVNLAEVRDKRQAFVNTVMNFRIPENVGDFSTS